MEKDWFKYRGYPHISNVVPLSKKKEMTYYVQSREKVAKHSFLPFILNQKIQRRYKRVDADLAKRSHKKTNNGVTKSTKKVRPIMYSCHQDAHVYAYYSNEIIQPKYEELLKEDELLDQAVIAYRSLAREDGKGNKNNIYFAKEVFDEIKKRKNCTTILFDIKNFFPTINHKQLKATWCKTLGTKSLPKDHYNIFKSVSNYSFINLKYLKTQNGHFDEKRLAKIRKEGKHSYFHNVKEFLDSDITIYKNKFKDKGIPQGLPISALLANMYMFPFDKNIIENLCKQKGVFYRRYSDDMIFICQGNQVGEIKAYIENAIKEIKLEISEDKTEIISFMEKTYDKTGKLRLESRKEHGKEPIDNFPLSYLGFEFYGYQTLIKSRNIGKFYRQMKESIGRKARRVEKLKEKYLVDELPIFKRKIYRLYSYKGAQKRILYLENGREEKYRGNFIGYALKAAETLEAPEIKHQIRNHWKVLQETINKYDFSNK